jgi:hypothetical protein
MFPEQLSMDFHSVSDGPRTCNLRCMFLAAADARAAGIGESLRGIGPSVTGFLRFVFMVRIIAPSRESSTCLSHRT